MFTPNKMYQRATIYCTRGSDFCFLCLDSRLADVQFNEKTDLIWRLTKVSQTAMLVLLMITAVKYTFDQWFSTPVLGTHSSAYFRVMYFRLVGQSWFS